MSQLYKDEMFMVLALNSRMRKKIPYCAVGIVSCRIQYGMAREDLYTNVSEAPDAIG